jgi:DNA-binding NarL/FixJ family response regulator
MRSPLALLVEDDPLQLSYRPRLLSELGVEVQAAVDLRTARELIESRKFDVVVTDIKIGGLPRNRGFCLLGDSLLGSCWRAALAATLRADSAARWRSAGSPR